RVGLLVGPRRRAGAGLRHDPGATPVTTVISGIGFLLGEPALPQCPNAAHGSWQHVLCLAHHRLTLSTANDSVFPLIRRCIIFSILLKNRRFRKWRWRQWLIPG